MSLYLFHDDFNGAAGIAPNPAKWWATPWISNSPDDAVVSYNAKNAHLDGKGNLVLKVSVGTMGRPYDGARVQTFKEGGWPPPQVLTSVDPPVHLEARMKVPVGLGLWSAFWPMGIDSANPIEIDICEVRGAHPGEDSIHVHNVVEWGFGANPGVALTSGFHRYWADYHSDHILFGLDGQPLGRCDGALGAQRVAPRLSAVVGPPGTWGGEGGPPRASALPAFLLVDYVRAWRL